MVATDQTLTRERPKATISFSKTARTSLQVFQALIVFSILAWVSYRGAQAMDYNWQWYRVPRFFYREIDGEIIWGPLVLGFIETLRLAGISIIFAILIGLVTAFARLSNSLAG